MKNKNGFIKRGALWVKEKIKGTDRFAIPISLNFNGQSSFKTGIGGIVSAIILLALLGYSVLLCKEMINRESRVINSNTKIENLIYNPYKYNLNNYNFALSIYAVEASGSHFIDPSYFTLDVKQIKTTK